MDVRTHARSMRMRAFLCLCAFMNELCFEIFGNEIERKKNSFFYLSNNNSTKNARCVKLNSGHPVDRVSLVLFLWVPKCDTSPSILAWCFIVIYYNSLRLHFHHVYQIGNFTHHWLSDSLQLIWLLMHLYIVCLCCLFLSITFHWVFVSFSRVSLRVTLLAFPFNRIIFIK